MTLEARSSGRAHRADIVAVGNDDRVVLIGMVKSMSCTGEIGISQTLEYLEDSEAPFGMFADFDRIAFFRKDSEYPRLPILELTTSEVLSLYEPRFAEKRISPDYFAALIEGWLRDYAFHWKSERPPAFEEMTRIGLSERLAGGMTSGGTVDVEHRLF